MSHLGSLDSASSKAEVFSEVVDQDMEPQKAQHKIGKCFVRQGSTKVKGVITSLICTIPYGQYIPPSDTSKLILLSPSVFKFNFNICKMCKKVFQCNELNEEQAGVGAKNLIWSNTNGKSELRAQQQIPWLLPSVSSVPQKRLSVISQDDYSPGISRHTQEFKLKRDINDGTSCNDESRLRGVKSHSCVTGTIFAYGHQKVRLYKYHTPSDYTTGAFKEMLHILSHQRNVNQKNSEIPSYTCQNGYDQKH
ncbi:hypothetical protein STEG23_009755 [Scotinomys teguina]